MKHPFTGLETTPVAHEGRNLGYVETHGPLAHSAVTSKGGRVPGPNGRGFFYSSVAAARTALITDFQRSPWPTNSAQAGRSAPADPEWTVIGIRWNESPEDAAALTVLPGTLQPADYDVTDELSCWIRHLRAPSPEEAMRLAKASAASAEAIAAFGADDT
jgi:hypothetical protein